MTFNWGKKKIDGGIRLKTKLDCNIVRDMLPMYIEKLTSEESNVAIRQHLDRCEDCMRHFENLKKHNYYLTEDSMYVSEITPDNFNVGEDGDSQDIHIDTEKL